MAEVAILMVSGGTGLGDNQRMIIGLVFTALLTVNGGMAGLAATNAIEVPALVYFGLGLAAMLVYAIKDQLGIRDATSAAVAKVADPASNNTRDTSDSIGPK